MGKIYDRIGGRLRDFVLAQPVFFVATAPSGADGHINLSPKGTSGSLAILDEQRVAFLDYTGSGAETIAHLRQNGRIALMFCAFTGSPTVVRLHGRGEPIFPADPRFGALTWAFPPPEPGLRSIIMVDVTRISDSCGYSVPFMDYVGERDLLSRYNGRKTEAEITEYQMRRNATSVDGLPAVPVSATTHADRRGVGTG
jgi:hypothetical protein